MTTPTLLNYSSVVLPLINEPVSTVVLSAPLAITGAISVSTNTPGASFYANGANHGQSVAYGGTTLIQIQVTTSAQFNTATHVVFTANGVQYTFTAVTAADFTLSQVQTPLQFSLTDANTITRNTAQVTNAITVLGLDQGISVPVSVPPSFLGAYIFKNGQNVGTSSIAALNDVISVHFTAPSTYGSSVQVPLFIGNIYDYFYAVTNSANDVPVGFVFPQTTGVDFSVAVTSAPVVVAGLDTNAVVTLSVDTGGTIIKNGVVVSTGLSTPVVNGDSIAIRTTAAPSPNYDTATYITVRVGTTYKTYWSVTTKTSTDKWIVPEQQGRALYDLGLGGVNSSSISFNGTTDALKLANSTAYAMPGAFTIEFWVKPSVNTTGQIIGTGANGANQWCIGFSATYGLYFYFGVYGQYQTLRYLTPATAPAVNVWTHVAIVRDTNSSWTFYVNGIATPTFIFAQNAGYNAAYPYPNQLMYVSGGQGGFYNGLIANLRMVVGIPVYLSNFVITTPVTAPTAITGTSLLLFVGKDLLDTSGVPSTITTIGSPSVSIDSPSSPPSATLNAANTLYQIDTTSYATKSTTSLYNPTVTADATLSTFLYSLSYYESLTYKINTAGVVTQKIVNPAGYTVYDECYAPKYVLTATPTPTKRFIAIANTTTGIIRDTTGVNPDITMGVGLLPYGLDSDLTGATMYATLSNNTLAKMVLNKTTGFFALSNYINLAGGTLGGFRQVAVDTSNRVWVVDVYNNRVVVVNSSDAVVASVSLPGCLDPWDICVDGSLTAWVVGSYSNSLARIDANFNVTYVQCSGVPCTVAVDYSKGYVWVGHYGSNVIDVFDPSSLELIHKVTLSQPVNTLAYDSAKGSMWAQCLYKDIATFQSRLTPITQVTPPLTFTHAVDVPVSGSVTSNTAGPVAGLVRPVSMSVPSGLGYSLVVNGVANTAPVKVKNGDYVYVAESAVSSKNYTTTTAIVQAGSSQSFSFSTTTVRDLVPDPIYFDNIDEVPAGSVVTSGIATITGISPGVTLNLTLEDSTWTIVVNGVAPLILGAPVTAVLGDTIQISGTLSASIASLTPKSVNILVDVASVPTVFGNFTVYSQQVDEKVPSLQNAPARLVPMFYEQSVRKPHISLVESIPPFEQYVHHNVHSLLTDSASAMRGLSVSVSYADWFLSSQRLPNELKFVDAPSGVRGNQPTQPTTGTPVSELRQPPLITFDLDRQYERGYAVDSRAIPRSIQAVRGIVNQHFEIGPIKEFKRSRVDTDLPTYFNPSYEKDTPNGFREMPARLYEPNTVSEARYADAAYAYDAGKTWIDNDPDYIYVAGRTTVETDREYEVGIQPHYEFADNDPTMFPRANHVLSGFEYVMYDNQGRKESDWLPPETKPRETAKYVTPANKQVYHVHYERRTFGMGFIKQPLYGRLVSPPDPIRTFIVDDSGGGPVDTQQHLYTSAAKAIAAGTALGYVNVTAYSFNTVVYQNGIPVPTKAYMYVVPVGVSSRNCLLDMPMNNNVIPYKWYVQGG